MNSERGYLSQKGIGLMSSRSPGAVAGLPGPRIAPRMFSASGPVTRDIPIPPFMTIEPLSISRAPSFLGGVCGESTSVDVAARKEPGNASKGNPARHPQPGAELLEGCVDMRYLAASGNEAVVFRCTSHRQRPRSVRQCVGWTRQQAMFTTKPLHPSLSKGTL